MSNWKEYKNGNYVVFFNSKNGTKIRRTEEDDFIPAFAENCDCKITDRCDGGCEFCYEGCTPTGKHGDILNYKFLDTLHPYTELAINGNDLSHPYLIPFLEKLKEKEVFANITVNQVHFMRYEKLIEYLVNKKLVYGVGISLREPTNEFINLVKKYPNAVIHVINGIFSEEDYNKLKDNNLKILILGYKNLRRGVDFYEKNNKEINDKISWLYNNLDEVTKHFFLVSFDNLALSQLETKRIVSEEVWNEIYMGDDGAYTFYIDLVEGTFGKNSLATERYPILDNIDEMFEKIKTKK